MFILFWRLSEACFDEVERGASDVAENVAGFGSVGDVDVCVDFAIVPVREAVGFFDEGFVKVCHILGVLFDSAGGDS